MSSCKFSIDHDADERHGERNLSFYLQDGVLHVEAEEYEKVPIFFRLNFHDTRILAGFLRGVGGE